MQFMCYSNWKKLYLVLKNDLSFSVIIPSKKLKINFDESKISKEEILNKLNEKKFDYEKI